MAIEVSHTVDDNTKLHCTVCVVSALRPAVIHTRFCYTLVTVLSQDKTTLHNPVTAPRPTLLFWRTLQNIDVVSVEFLQASFKTCNVIHLLP